MPSQFLNSLQNLINLNYILHHDIQNSNDEEFVTKKYFFFILFALFLLILRILIICLNEEINRKFRCKNKILWEKYEKDN
jgi:hypothetical protein